MYLNIMNTKTLCRPQVFPKSKQILRHSWHPLCYSLVAGNKKEENQSDCFLHNTILQFLKHKATSSHNSSKTKHKQSHHFKQWHHISIFYSIINNSMSYLDTRHGLLDIDIIEIHSS